METCGCHVYEISDFGLLAPIKYKKDVYMFNG